MKMEAEGRKPSGKLISRKTGGLAPFRFNDDIPQSKSIDHALVKRGAYSSGRGRWNKANPGGFSGHLHLLPYDGHLCPSKCDDFLMTNVAFLCGLRFLSLFHPCPSVAKTFRGCGAAEPGLTGRRRCARYGKRSNHINLLTFPLPLKI